MPRCAFCGKERPIHKMATKETDDDGETAYYCSSECVRTERKIDALRENVGELTGAMERLAASMRTDERIAPTQ